MLACWETCFPHDFLVVSSLQSPSACASSQDGVACAQQALGVLAVPCLMVALHSLPAVLLLLFLHCWSGSPAAISKLTSKVLKGSVPMVALHTVQVGPPSLLLRTCCWNGRHRARAVQFPYGAALWR